MASPTPMTTPAKNTDPAAPTRSRRKPRIILGVLAGAIVLLGICQLLLPKLAAERLRTSLAQHAIGVHVSVSAFPAVELIFGHADRVNVQIKRLLPAGHSSLEALLARIGHAGRLDAKVGSMTTDGLRLTDVSLHKRSSQLTASASVTKSAIESALPSNLQLSNPTSAGDGLNFLLSVGLFGKSLGVAARVQARDGKLEIGPASPALSLIRIPIFSDPEVKLSGLTMSVINSAYTFNARGSYT